LLICGQCKVNILSNRQKRFCSAVCQTAASRKPLPNCISCGKEFYTRNTNPKHCSYKCAHVTRSITGIGKRTGAKHTAEQRLKMSLGQKKRFKTQPTWNKGLLGYRSGSMHHNWKGGVSSQDKADRQIFAQQIRSLVFARDNYTCQICQDYGGRLHVDHITQWKDDPGLRFELSNCRTLCVPCHYYVTFKRTMPKSSKWGMRPGVAT
jgi:hypothetical protein